MELLDHSTKTKIVAVIVAPVLSHRIQSSDDFFGEAFGTQVIERPTGAILDDILVVSPYNMQVNHLRDILPLGARVGTVDKFQDQEAAVVLISMTTSSGDDLPRNIEFLYSRNRLNVAISRARCLSISHL
jgi:hypothetical protein